MSGEDYLELLDAALDAIRDVIAETEPGTGMGLHHAFNEIKAAAKVAAPPMDDPAEHKPRDRAAEAAQDRERKPAWRAAPLALREHIVLEAIGDQRLSVWELTVHLYRTRPDVYVTQESLRKLLRHLVGRGELHEVDEFPPPRHDGQRRGGRRRRVYSRDGELSGSIAALEQVFNETKDEVS